MTTETVSEPLQGLRGKTGVRVLLVTCTPVPTPAPNLIEAFRAGVDASESFAPVTTGVSPARRLEIVEDLIAWALDPAQPKSDTDKLRDDAWGR